MQGHVGAADRRGPGAPVGLQHVAVHRDLLPRPAATRSHTARSDRAIRRWISWVRPDWRPLAASRQARSAVEPGSIEYSAVTQPLPRPRIHGGTRSSTEAVHSTLVRPIDTSTEPGAKTVKSRSKRDGAELVERPAVGPKRSGVDLVVAHRTPPLSGSRGSPLERGVGRRLVDPAPERLAGLVRQGRRPPP